MAFVLTAFFTFVLIGIALLVFLKLGPPVYRVEKINVIRLLELIVSGQATESDWHVFTAYTIRHDPYLMSIQQRCIDIAEREYTGGHGLLFTKAGIMELQKILEELKNTENGEKHG